MQLSRVGRGGVIAAALPVAALISLTGCSSSSTSACGSPSTPAVSSSTGPGSQGSTPAGTSSAAATGSCSVITAAQASAALGGQPVTGPFIGNATVESGKACVYYGPEVPPGASPNIPLGDTVRVVLVTGPNAQKFFNDYESKVNAQPISGLGDKAFYDGYASISVLKGDEYVRIAVGVVNPLPPEKVLAADALTKM